MNWERAACAPGGEPAEWSPGRTGTGDDRDWWFRTRLEVPAAATLRFGGLATHATVLVDGDAVAASASMWLPLDVPLAAGAHEVTVRCAALDPLLAVRRKPRARWRTRVADNALRFHRTTLLGRAPGFAPGPPVVGLWRPATLVDPSHPEVRLRARLRGDDGVLLVQAPDDVTVRCGGETTVSPSARRELLASGDVTRELRLERVARWWPHTHGDPVLHEVTIERAGVVLERRRVGWRTLWSPGELEVTGLDLHVNDVPVFARGALWTPVPEGEERATLERLVGAGLNCVRVVGTGAYESPAFHDLCDELGLLVWQDLMFANLDYPFADPDFRALATREVEHQLGVVAGRPSLAVVCGNSESEQQVAMLGLDPAMARGPFFDHDVPRALAEAGADAVYVPSAPCGADRPFRPDRGVANWFGVGGYRRPLADARAAGVRFASECLAVANLPDGDPDGFVPGDAGADWDFADVREHYVCELYGVDPAALDGERALALGRAVSGELAAEVFGEWRRAGSPCRGGLILWLRDRDPGAGWGLLDHAGAPKAVLGPLARSLAPVAVWTTDEGQAGLTVHVANDRPRALGGAVRIALYRDAEHLVDEARVPVEVDAHGTWEADVEALLGRWVDVSYAYRFGPPQQDLVVVSLEAPDGTPIAQHGRFPAGRPAGAHTAAELGLEATLHPGAVTVRSRRAAVGVRVAISGAEAADDGFLVEPGHERTVALRGDPGPGELTALNLTGAVALQP